MFATRFLEGQLNNMANKALALGKQAAGDFFLSLVRPVLLVTQLLYRRDFGERYLNSRNFSAAMGLVIFAMLPGDLYVQLAHAVWSPTQAQVHTFQFDTTTRAVGVIWLAWLFVAFARERTALRRRYQEGILWHSYSHGTSWLDEKFDEAHQGAIPVVLGVGLIVAGVYGLGGLLILSGVMCSQAVVYARKVFHNMVLDAIDAQIESEHLSQAIMKHSRPKDTEGFAAGLPAYVSDQFREKFVQKAMPDAPPRSSKAA